MYTFEQSSIWKKTLAEQSGQDPYKENREFLRTEFMKFREKAKTLANEISRDLPDYTVHDITHIDALWDMADLIVPEELDINPAEAFVLGGSFLLHDLGMAVASYPGGLDEIKKEQIWIDAATGLLKNELHRKVSNEDLINISSDLEKQATEKTLRYLHAQRAHVLAKLSWKDSEDQDVFLIENTELRDSFGTIIGLIAHSHWWKVEDLEDKLLKSHGSLGNLPSGWEIKPLKLACILRVADAMQIDDRRSPSFLRVIRKPDGFSDSHWNFQNKLFKPILENNKLKYTSKNPFEVDEIESWWLCHDTLKMIDDELRNTDALLTSKYGHGLSANGVVDIEDTKRLSKLIAIEGWEPVDTKIRVNDVGKLVNNIGGTQLYGNNFLVPLRELIQNASDAIRARRIYDDETDDFGDVVVRLKKDEIGTYIEVEDNGIGMSKSVLTGPFLDFGQSFWGTDLMHEELPGLESKRFTPTGKYGIGFFSLFMWSDEIRVTTNKCGNRRDETLVLEFKNGAFSRPILRNAKESEFVKGGGTRVRVWIKDQILDDLLDYSGEVGHSSFLEVIENVCLSMDCNINFEEKEVLKPIIKANDWMKISSIEFLKRILGKKTLKNIPNDFKNYLNVIINNMELIKDENGKIIGRAALFSPFYSGIEEINWRGIVTVGGFKTSELTGIVGILLGYNEKASRDVGTPLISNTVLLKWVENQTQKLSNQTISDEIQIKISEISRLLGSETKNLKIAICDVGNVNYEEIKSIVEKNSFEEWILVPETLINLFEIQNSCQIYLNKNVFSLPSESNAILYTGNSFYNLKWPKFSSEFKYHNLKKIIIEAFVEVWHCDINDIYKGSQFTDYNNFFSYCIGNVEGKDVVIDYVDIIKKPNT